MSDDDRHDDLVDTDPTDSARVSCPWCGATQEVYVDLGGGLDQSYVEDCEVCCRPWDVHVVIQPMGPPSVTLTAQDG